MGHDESVVYGAFVRGVNSCGLILSIHVPSFMPLSQTTSEIWSPAYNCICHDMEVSLSNFPNLGERPFHHQKEEKKSALGQNTVLHSTVAL